MLRLNPYFPAAGVAVPVADINAAILDTELAHYRGVIAGKLDAAGFDAQGEKLDGLLIEVRRFLGSAFESLLVAASQWRDGPWHGVLYALWDGGDKVSAEWRSKLRRHHELCARCPYCGFLRDSARSDKAATAGSFQDMDHYLPRAQYPELSIVPTNLVPTCDTCNSRLKKELGPASDGARQFLHPYFDEFIDNLELIATVEMTCGEPRHEFSLARTAGLRDDEQRVAASHFEKLKLANRYLNRLASDTLVQLRKRIEARAAHGKIAGVADIEGELEIEIESTIEARGPQHFEVAALRALRNSEDYVAWLYDVAASASRRRRTRGSGATT